MYKWIIALCIVGGTLLIVEHVDSCNEAICGSVVSKCLLTKSCNCDLKSCTCCKDCFNCLSYLYSECCSCVGMCTKPNDTETILSRKSHVEDFDGVPALFSVLTESPDVMKRWDTKTFPVDIQYSHYGVHKEFKVAMQSAEQEVMPSKAGIITLNCTVAFWSQCMSWTKCRTSCQSMGASSYRWFHDGCCECIGEYCINYGINESRCSDCSEENEEMMKADEDDYDYGEGDDDEEDEEIDD